MKKTLALLCAVATVLGMLGCTKNPQAQGDAFQQSPAGNNSEATTTEVKEEKVQYDENAPLFICQDRADIEGDRDAIYYYNYKGSQLENAVLPNVGFFGNSSLAPARDPSTWKIGYVDKTGVFVIAPQWDDASAFSDDGIALVITEVENEEGWAENKYGFINEKGEQIAPCIYDDATSFYPQGVAIVGVEKEIKRTEINDDGKEETYTESDIVYGVIDKAGTVIIDTQYDHICNVEGDYILCDGEKGQALYDLSGKPLVTEAECEENQYYFLQNASTLTRWTQKILSNAEAEENNGIPFRFSEQRVFNGSEFVEPPYDYDAPVIYSKSVATTATGTGYGVIQITGSRQENNLREIVYIPYEYDRIVKSGNHYIAIKYEDANGEKQSFDIYNSDFEKTAENINYKFEQHRGGLRDYTYGENMMLPNGYFQISYYDADIGETLHGIINEYGETIVPVLFYRTIKLYVYECVGGKFMTENNHVIF